MASHSQTDGRHPSIGNPLLWTLLLLRRQEDPSDRQTDPPTLFCTEITTGYLTGQLGNISHIHDLISMSIWNLCFLFFGKEPLY